MRKNDMFGLLLLAFVIGCRVHTPLADLYAEKCYPVISDGFSRIASIFPFSLEEIVVICFVLAFIFVLVRAVRKKEGFLRWLGGTARVTMWLIVWFYIGWGINYFRTPLYPRMGIERVSYDENTFSHFLSDYTKALNNASEEAVSWNWEELEADVREFYSTTLPEYGYTYLHHWQDVKDPLLNRLYSAVGVLGFMGPFFCESQLNLELPDLEYPFTLAHELAHLAGVTSEAEANYWAYVYCRQSEDPAVRYSGYLSLLPHAAASAGSLLSEERYGEWAATVADKVKEDYAETSRLWEKRRIGIINTVQRWMMDRFLKTNGVSEGAKDYYGVIGMIITFSSFSPQPERTGAYW